MPANESLPEIYAISRLCNPNIKEVERESWKLFLMDHLDPYYNSEDAFCESGEEFWRAEKGKLPYQFRLRREDHDGGGEGTVIVITRP